MCRRWRAAVYDVDLRVPRSPTTWRDEEWVHVIGPEDFHTALTPAVRVFLGPTAHENLTGVYKDNRLFLISNHEKSLHCGYVLFRTRQAKILGEPDSTPIIACCLTAPEARGQGLYRKALNEELCYLQERGYERAVVETHPENIPSRKGIEAVGFRFCRTVDVWILLNWLVIQKNSGESGVRWRSFTI